MRNVFSDTDVNTTLTHNDDSSIVTNKYSVRQKTSIVLNLIYYSILSFHERMTLSPSAIFQFLFVVAEMDRRSSSSILWTIFYQTRNRLSAFILCLSVSKNKEKVFELIAVARTHSV